MAKKSRKMELNDLRFDDGLDFPEFDFEMTPPKDDRSPATKAVHGAATGFKDGVLSDAFVKNAVKEALPKSYGTMFDFADQSARSLKDLYNTSTKELKPVLNDLRRTTKRVLPAADKILPQSLKKRLQEFADGGDRPNSALDQREAGLQAELGQIFQAQMDQQQQQTATQDVKDKIRENIDQSRHRDTLGQLDGIRTAVTQLSAYQTNVGVNFQRKSLELQYRQYFIALDTLEEVKRSNAAKETQLASITKNTGLPDFVKLRGTERFSEAMRNKFIDSIQDGVIDKRRDFVKNVMKRVSASVLEKVKNFSDGLQSGISSADSMLDMQEMMADMGGGPDGVEMAGQMAGGMGAEYAGKRIGKAARAHLPKIPLIGKKIIPFGNRGANFVENLPQKAKAWSDDYGGNFVIRWLKELVSDELGAGPNVTLDSDTARNIQEPGSYTRQANKSITEIIPGYLARIFRELQVMRTGDDNIELTRYDFSRNQFSTNTKIKQGMFSTLFSRYDRENLQDDVGRAIDEIDPEKTLNEDQRRALGKFMLRDNLRNGDPTAKRMSDFMTYDGDAMRYSDEYSDLFREYFSNDDSFGRQRGFAKTYGNLGSRLPDHRAMIQDWANAGQLDLLAELGILNSDGTGIDLEKLQDYYFDGKLPDAPKGSSGKRRHRGGASGLAASPRRRGPFGGGGSNVSPTPETPENTTAQVDHRSDFTTAIGDLRNAVQNIKVDVAPLAEALKAESTKATTETISETLLRIEQQLQQGIPSYGVDGGAGPEGGAWYNRSILSNGRSLLRGAGKAFGYARGEAGKMFDRARGLAGFGLGKARQGLGWLAGKRDVALEKARGKLKEWEDIYIKGMAEPVLLEWKLKAGHYRDQVTGKIIETYDDIKGTIVDENGKVIITGDMIKQLVTKSKFGQRMLDTAGKAWAGAKGAFHKLRGMAGGVYGVALDAGQRGLSMMSDYLDGPQDVYTADDLTTPKLTALQMRAGSYYSKTSGKAVMKVSEIDGPVATMVGDREEVMLSLDDIKKGLVDAKGKPIRHGLGRLLGGLKDMARRGLGAILSAGGKLKGLVAGAFGAMGSLFGTLIGKDGLIFAGGRQMVDYLKEIRDILDSRLPGGKKVSGDADGDGVRDGSVQDQQTKRASKLNELRDRMSGMKDQAKGLLSFESMKGLFNKFRGKDDEEGPAEDDGSMLDDAADVADIADFMDGDGNEAEGKSSKRKPKGKWARFKDGAKGKGRGLWSRGKGLMGRIPGVGAAGRMGKGIWNAGRGALGFGKQALGRGVGAARGLTSMGPATGGALLAVGGAGLSAYDTYTNKSKTGNEKDVAYSETAGGLAGGLSGAWAGAAGGAATGAAIGSIFPVVGTAIGGAVGGVVGGIAGSIGGDWIGSKLGGAVGKGMFSDKLTSADKFRMAQYGFMPSDDRSVQTILDLERMLAKGLIYDKGYARLDPAKIDQKAVVQTFGADLGNNVQVNNWIRWFMGRFKPVYLVHMSALNKIKPGTALADLGKLTPKEMMAYIDIARLPSGPYSTMVSPFPSMASLVAGGKEVTQFVQLATDEYGKLAGTAKDKATPVAEIKAAAVATATVSTMASTLTATQKPGDAFDRPTIDMKSGFESNRGLIYVAADASPLSQTFNGQVDGLSAIRFKTYGLREMDPDKIRALTKLEGIVAPGVKFSTDKLAEWKGSPDEVLGQVGGAFGITGINNDAAFKWKGWFNARFLPTYLNYVTSLMRITGKQDIKAALLAVRPADRLEVAMSIYGTSGVSNGAKAPVWMIPVTPWPGYALNSDVSTTDANIQGLREAAKVNNLSEQRALDRDGVAGNEAKKALVGGAADASKVANESGGFFSGMANKASNLWDKAASTVSDAAGGAWQGIKDIGADIADAVGFGGGNEVTHPGKGTGGDINSLPTPTGSGYSAVRGLIEAAAKMAGVDTHLMTIMAAIESGFNPKAKAPTSSASGLYQFLTDPKRGSTWESMIKRYGAKYGIAPGTSPFDPKANALMGAEFIKENAGALKSVKSRLTDTDLYMAHFLGAGGAKQFLSQDPSKIAAHVMPKQAAANKGIFYNQDGSPRTFSQVYAHLNGLVRNKGKQFGIVAGGGAQPMAPNQPVGAPAAQVPPSSTPQPAKPAAPAPATKIPISNQMSVMTPSSKPATKPAVASKTPAGTTAPSVTTNSSAGPVDASVDGYQSTAATQRRSAGLKDQAAYRDSMVQGAIGRVGDELANSLEIQRQQLDVLKQLLKVISMNGKSASSKVGEPTGSAAGSVRGQRAGQVPELPVLFRKPAG